MPRAKKTLLARMNSQKGNKSCLEGPQIKSCVGQNSYIVIMLLVDLIYQKNKIIRHFINHFLEELLICHENEQLEFL